MSDDAKRVEEYRQAFNLFDKDKDGYISVEELATVMRSVGQNPTPTELRELIGQGRAGQYTARDGKIDFELFQTLMCQKMKDVDSEMELRDAFRLLDPDGKGYIGTAELKTICSNLGEELDEEDVFKMVKEAILNFDGKIYYDGFKKIMIAH